MAVLCHLINNTAILKHQVIPIFPLSVTILPGEKQKLHVFEPRYQQLMRDIKDSGWFFGIPFVKGDNLYKFGCYVKVIKTTSFNPESGEMDVIVEGQKTFRLNRLLQKHNQKLYDSALIEWLDDGSSKSCEDLLIEFRAYFDELKESFRPFKDPEKMSNIWNIVRFLPLTEDEKIRFVSLREPEKRRVFLKNKIKILREINRKTIQLSENIYYN